ncbi:hypothetical protein ACFOW4_20725 [Micromonospora sp. GCM10011542]|uniref:hypothetical protein n=1 Tax=Micromonospora sp. GCM10011542 TaxID=3317337 RepID=UPI00360925CA
MVAPVIKATTVAGMRWVPAGAAGGADQVADESGVLDGQGARVAISSPRLARAPLGATAAVVSVCGSLWAWRSLGYDFVEDGNDSSKVLLWTTIEVGTLSALAVKVSTEPGAVHGFEPTTP